MEHLPITLVDYAHPEGYKDAKTEFIAFVNSDQDLLALEQLLQVYKDNPQFRKLSMVAPAVKTPDMTVYGWESNGGVIVPRNVPSSREPYPVQIGSVTNSVIRRSALDRVCFDFTGSNLMDSVLLSFALWESGQRCFMAPLVYIIDQKAFNRTLQYEPDYPQVHKLFKREMIG